MSSEVEMSRLLRFLSPIDRTAFRGQSLQNVYFLYSFISITVRDFGRPPKLYTPMAENDKLP